MLHTATDGMSSVRQRLRHGCGWLKDCLFEGEAALLCVSLYGSGQVLPCRRTVRSYGKADCLMSASVSVWKLRMIGLCDGRPTVANHTTHIPPPVSSSYYRATGSALGPRRCGGAFETYRAVLGPALTPNRAL